MCIMSHKHSSSSSPPSPAPPRVSPVPPAPAAQAVAEISPPAQNARVSGSVKGTKAPMQNGTVAIDEMIRLMRVYGPIKSIRVRTTDPKGTKLMSIKRKFYRWFPDFSERFVQTPEGWYTPRAGHEAEMKYRAAMREEDEMELISLRAAKRRENFLKKRAAKSI